MPESIRRGLAAKRPDLIAVADLIPPGVKVLDLGCGDGALLKLLRLEKGVGGVGVELDQENILKCVAGGVPVIHGDLDHSLRFFSDGAYDFVLLGQTIQALRRPDRLLDEMLRIGGKGVISFINFGFFRLRAQLLLLGRMPESRDLPYHWYDTPNIHLGTISDFRRLCAEKRFRVEAEIPIGESYGPLASLYPNLFARTCVFVISKA
jgi:methionine biosynthesis protein MetW